MFVVTWSASYVGQVSRVRVHDLRHTAATLMLWDYAPIKAVSNIVGHESIRITPSTCTHMSWLSNWKIPPSTRTMCYYRAWSCLSGEQQDTG